MRYAAMFGVLLVCTALEAEPIQIGSRVRVRKLTAEDFATRLVEGRVASIDSTGLDIRWPKRMRPRALRSESAVTRIPWDNVLSIEVAVGTRARRFARGIGYGFATGAIMGAMIGYDDGDDPPDSWVAFSAGDKAIILGGLIGGVGLVVGGIAGLATGRTEWHQGERPTGLSLIAVPGGAMVRVARRF